MVHAVCEKVLVLVENNVRTADLLVWIVVAYDCTGAGCLSLVVLQVIQLDLPDVCTCDIRVGTTGVLG